MIDILVPTYKRPEKIAPLMENVQRVTKSPYNLLFIIEAHDLESRKEAKDRGANSLIGNFGTYANAINVAFALTSAPFFFTGSDDILFDDEWDDFALKAMQKENVDVVGVNDGNGICILHFLVRRNYVQTLSGVIDMPGLVFYPYMHHFVDTEFYWTARTRGRFTTAPDSVVRHFMIKEGETFEKSIKHDVVDEMTYKNRRHLFRGA